MKNVKESVCLAMKSLQLRSARKHLCCQTADKNFFFRSETLLPHDHCNWFSTFQSPKYVNLNSDWVKTHPEGGFKSASRISLEYGNRMWSLLNYSTLLLHSQCARKYVCMLKIKIYKCIYCFITVVLTSYCHKQRQTCRMKRKGFFFLLVIL